MAAVTNASPVTAYVVLGMPGSGKDTFANTLKDAGYVNISTGNILREEVKQETDFGKKYKDIILDPSHAGTISSEEIEPLVTQRMETALESQKGFILNGFPKSVEQCKFLDSYFEKKGLKNRVVVVILDLKEQAAVDRIFFRQVCNNCNIVYNTKLSPPKNAGKCDDCHASIEARADFTPEGTTKRIFDFKTKIEPVTKYYNNRLYHLDVNNFTRNESINRFVGFHNSFNKV